VLDELAREGVRATFFVIGERAQRHPELVERTLAEGHEVELHCMRHRWHGLQPRSELEADTREALAVLGRAGARPGRWRPPYGKAEWWSEEVADAHGLRLTGASCDPRDWSGEGTLAAMRAAEPDLQAGNVVVMHDGAEVEGDSRADTVALIGPLLEAARRRGLEPAPLANGPAFWWLRRGTRPDPSVTFEVVDEGELADEDRRQAFALLAEGISHAREDYAERGYRLVRPAFRVLARAGGAVVGHTGVCMLRSDPDFGFAGLADGVVSPRLRERGIGAEMMGLATREALARGAGGVLADTTAYARWCARTGFRRPLEGELSRRASTSPRPRHWWLLREGEPEPFLLIDDDF